MIRRLTIAVLLTLAIPNAPVFAGDQISFRRGNVRFSLFDVSVRKLSLNKGDRVERFECDVSGSVERIDVPFEWRVTIDNPTGDHAKVIAEAKVGAAALPDDTHYFQGFLRVGKMSVSEETPHFDMRITLWISDKDDKMRNVKLTLPHLELMPASSS